MISYKDILVNYTAMVNEASSKEEGIKKVKADWVEKKTQIDDIHLTAIVDVGIEVLEKSRTSFDIKGFLEYKGLSESDVYNVPFDLVYLLWNLTDVYNNSSMKAFLEDIASRMEKNIVPLSTTMRELLHNYMEKNIVPLSATTRVLLHSNIAGHIENIKNSKEYHLNSDVLNYSEEEWFDRCFSSCLSDVRIGHILIDYSSEVEKELWAFFNNSYETAGVMQHLYPNLYEKIKEKSLKA